MKKNTSQPQPEPGTTARTSRPAWALLRGLLLLLAAFTAVSVQAQSIRFRPVLIRVTVPANNAAGNSVLITNFVSLNGINGSGASLNVSGLPAGASAILTNTTVTASGEVDFVVNATNIPEGVYTFSLNGSAFDTNGAPVTNYILFTLQSGFIWNGLANAAVNGAGNWADSTKWLGSAAANVPGPSDDVIFTDVGAQTNAFRDAPTYSYLVNSLITSDLSIGTLRFAQTNSATKSHVIQISDGKTLTINGNNAFTFLRDYMPSTSLQPMSVALIGTNATLVISNRTGNVALLADNNAPGSSTFQNMNALELTGLGRFNVEVNRIGLGDYQLYPNYDNLSGSNSINGGGIPKNYAAMLNLGRTNVIRAQYVDPNNFTNSVRRDYSLTLGNNERSGTSSNPQYTLNLGITNAFLVDSICFGHASLSSLVQFQPIFATNYNCTVLLRGTNGDRVSMLAASDIGQGDASMSSGSNDKGTINFAGGKLDALVDRMYLSRDRINSSGQNAQTTLILSKGTLDVNTAILGYQAEGNHTNTAYCEATVIVTNTATFKVNNEMVLGYTTADPLDPTANDTAGNNGTWGRLLLGPGGTNLINRITCGGLSKTSTNEANQLISMTTGARLFLTNTIGTVDAPLNLLSLTNGSGITLVNLSGTGPEIFVHTVATTGSGANANVINVASISGVTSFPYTNSVISYVNPTTAAFTVGTLPSGMVGRIQPGVSGSTIDLVIDTNVPETLVWRGTVNNIWDVTTSNWVSQASGLPARWVDGDFAVFDDTGSNSSITLAVDVFPGQSISTPGILVNSSTVNYSFNNQSAEGIRGSATLQKSGASTLTMNNLVNENAVVVTGGALAGNATIGNTVLQAGTTMTGFTGTINGGLDCSNAVVSVSTAVNGSLILRAGGLTNSGTITGTANLGAGSYLNNIGTMNVTVPWSVPTNAVLANNGTIVQTGPAGGNFGLTIDAGGTLLGTGKITLGPNTAGSDARVTLNGNLMIGNNLNEIASVTIATRLDFNAGSTTTFDVDLSNTNDVILLTDGFLQGKVNFGQNRSLGGTLIINRLGAVPFTSSSVLYLFDLTSNSPDNTAPAKPEVTPAPGPGLVWDISNMLTNLTLAVTGPPTLVSSTTSTNITFSWPSQYTGWRLTSQTNSLDVGLSTNWFTVSGSFSSNSIVVPIDPTNGAVFYRLSYP
jgi:hypothetical protein